ncbi:MAG: hypothetical protein WBP79_05440 [Candidatus Acidiferrales bacterium]
MRKLKFSGSHNPLRPFRWLLLAAFMLMIPATSSIAWAQVAVSITVAPPPLVVYTQPVCPGEGFIWTPGYWAYGDDGYYWVPGTWVEAPEVGFLWTPGYWGWSEGVYIWRAGYWGPHVGFYGGVNYGFGYVGTGFEGGYWRSGHYFYNRSVTNVNVTVIHNVYEKRVVDRGNRVAYNGGRDGIRVRPTREQESFAHERHIEATSNQERHREAARSDRSQYASVNHGRPAVAATPKPGEFKGNGVVPARPSKSDRATTTRSEAGRKAESTRTTRTETAKPRGSAPKPEPKRETKPAPTRESKPPAAHAPKPEPSREAKPAPEHATKPAPTRESKPPAESAPKPQAPRQSKPPAQPAAKPAAPQHEAKPPAQHEQKKP